MIAAQVESSSIMEYIDATYPEPALLRADQAKIADAQKATANVFPSLAAFLKAEEFDFYAEKALLSALADFEAFLATRKEGDRLLFGKDLSLLDCSLAPKMYVVDEGLGHFFPDTRTKVRERFKAVEDYMKNAFATEAFEETKYPRKTLVWGWDCARKEAGGKACGV